MDYRRAYLHTTQRPDWIKTVLLLAVCVLIPIVGVMVILGYRAELIDRWLKDGNDEKQDSFDFGRFGQQLQRGIWPFIYQLIIGLCLGPIVGVMYAMLIFVAITSKNQAVILIGFGLYFLSIFVLQIFVKAIIWPFTLHGQMTGKFDFGNAWKFARDFYSRIGFVNLASISLCTMVIDVVCVMIGLVLCFIGVYPAAAIIMMADNHILWQLYRKYLANGGTEIERMIPAESSGKADDNPSGGV